MAESGESADNSSWESWLGGWVQTAKEKSSTALEMVKKDLAEFTCTIHRDTERAVEMTKESLNKENTTHATNRVKAGLSSFLDNISRALVIPPDDDYIPVKVAPDGSGLYDRGKARLHAIQLDAGTYMDPPDGPPEQYKMWLQSFDIDQHKGEISELLVSKVEVRALYTRLVPSEVSHAEFWQRYFYRVHKLDCDEARKQALMKRADEARGDSFSWDDDDDDWSGNEEDNHSDWEKLPRPTQSTAAPPIQKPESKHEHLSVEESSQKPASDSHAMPAPVDGSELNVKEPKQKSVIKPTVEANMSAVAASSAQSKNEPTPESTGLPSFSPQPVASGGYQDAPSDLLSHQDLQLMTSADLWSLHTPSDISSASHTQQQDIQCTETGGTEAGSSLDVYKQEGGSGYVSGEPNSCAASGDNDVDDDKSQVVLADGACGTVDIDEAPRSPHQASEVCCDSYAASVEIAAEPDLALVEAVSCPSVVATEELTDLSEKVSAVASAFNSEVREESISGPASGHSVAAVTVLPAAENVAESSLVTVPKESSNLSQETSDDPNEDIDSSSKSTELPHEKESVFLPEAADGGNVKEIGMRLKGDMVVVGDRDSPLSSESNGTKELGLEEDWEQDFDIEITEDDLKSAENIAKQLGENLNAVDDDWENWE